VRHPLNTLRATALALALALPWLAGTALAQTTIDQAKALAGGVTPGDAPGFPVKITQPGSYKLTSNLSVPLHIQAIQVTAPGVTIDLNGFVVSSAVICDQGMHSTTVTCNLSNVASANLAYQAGISSNEHDTAVRNGTVRGFSGHGIHGVQHIENLHVGHNLGAGIYVNVYSNGVPARLSHVRNSRVELNNLSGVVGGYVLFEHSMANKNGKHGLHTDGGVVRNSMLSFNEMRGINTYGNSSTTVRGSDLVGNTGGATAGSVISLGGNSNGAVAF
jgi:hypothetical protein